MKESMSDAEYLLNLIDEHEMLNLGEEAATRAISKAVSLLCEDSFWTKKYMKQGDAQCLVQCFEEFSHTGKRPLLKGQKGGRPNLKGGKGGKPEIDKGLTESMLETAQERIKGLEAEIEEAEEGLETYRKAITTIYDVCDEVS